MGVARSGTKNQALSRGGTPYSLDHSGAGAGAVEGVTQASSPCRPVALATGLRQANVTNLEWSQIDMECEVAWVYADQAKGRRDIHVSLNSVAMDVLQRQLNKHPERVFTYCGKPIRWANTKGWRNAVTRAGIENFRWHDLRHPWASWHIQHGTPLYVVQEMGAWESEGMVRRYAHLAPAHLRQHDEVVSGLLNGTNTAQAGNEKGASAQLTP